MRQIISVIGMNTLALRGRIAASLVIVVGMTAVVAVALSIFSMAAGLQEMMRQGTAPDRMIVLSQGAANEFSSSVPRDSLSLISNAPGIRKGPDGKPVVSGELMSNYITKKKSNETQVFVLVNGVDPNILAMRPDIKLLQGRMFTPGRREVLAGKWAVAQFENIALGGQVVLQDGPWDVVGIVDGPGASGYVLYVDAETLLAALHRSAFGVVMARLEDSSEAVRTQFTTALKSNPALSVDVETEESYFARQIKGPSQFYALLAYGVGAIMGLGAIFGALNTMYAAVSTRVTEIATLRAIGFGPAAVVISIIVESLALAVLGAAAGALIAWVAFNGHKQDYGTIDVSLAVTPEMIAAAIGLALIVGTIGALFPAIRAARLPVTTALQGR
jgi:putative ABC transport system permease protein